MHRTIGDSYGTDGAKRIFRQENLPSYAATQATYDTMNALQEELANAIEGAGVALNTASESVSAMTQLDSVLKAYITTEAVTRDVNDKVFNGELAKTQINNLNSDVGNQKLVDNIRLFARDMQGYRLVLHSAVAVDVQPGICLSLPDGSAQTAIMNHTETPFRKLIDTAWAVGDLSGGLPSTLLPIVDGTWYHMFILKADPDIDAGFDTDITGANILAASGADFCRRVGSVYWINSGSGIREFEHVLDENYFLWRDSVPEHFGGIPAQPTITTLNLAKSIPLGLALPADCVIYGDYTGTPWQVYFWDGLLGGGSRKPNCHNIFGLSGITDRTWIRLITDISQNIYAEPSATTGGSPSISVSIRGYLDKRRI